MSVIGQRLLCPSDVAESAWFVWHIISASIFSRIIKLLCMCSMLNLESDHPHALNRAHTTSKLSFPVKVKLFFSYVVYLPTCRLGAIGVAVSFVQFGSALASSGTAIKADDHSQYEAGIKRSALVFFSLSTMFAMSGLAIHLSLTRLFYY